MARKQAAERSHAERLTVLETQLPALQTSMDAGFARLGADIGKANATLERLIQGDERRIGAEQERRKLAKHREMLIGASGGILGGILATVVHWLWPK